VIDPGLELLVLNYCSKSTKTTMHQILTIMNKNGLECMREHSDLTDYTRPVNIHAANSLVAACV